MKPEFRDRLSRDVDVSVVAPAHNEEGNIAALVDQVGRALGDAGLRFEFIIVDDGSTDRTREVVRALMDERPWLRCIAMRDTPPGRGNGQSAAFHSGFRAARGRVIASLDADLQNDPADIPGLLSIMDREGADMVQGDRSAARRDSAVRRWGSVVGRAFRKWLLGDSIRDTGCSLRVMRREVALQIPLEFKGIHRFIPITAASLGYRVIETPVTHRPRTAGETKYGMGITKRAIPGLLDLLAVRWMRARRRPVQSDEIAPEVAREADAEARVPAGSGRA